MKEKQKVTKAWIELANRKWERILYHWSLKPESRELDTLYLTLFFLFFLTFFKTMNLKNKMSSIYFWNIGCSKIKIISENSSKRIFGIFFCSGKNWRKTYRFWLRIKSLRGEFFFLKIWIFVGLVRCSPFYEVKIGTFLSSQAELSQHDEHGVLHWARATRNKLTKKIIIRKIWGEKICHRSLQKTWEPWCATTEMHQNVPVHVSTVTHD